MIINGYEYNTYVYHFKQLNSLMYIIITMRVYIAMYVLYLTHCKYWLFLITVPVYSVYRERVRILLPTTDHHT